jgi:hypothetical protein
MKNLEILVNYWGQLPFFDTNFCLNQAIDVIGGA